jgi:hypothetical protein
MRVVATMAVLVALVGACTDYATEESMVEVKSTVDDLDRRVVSDVTRIRAEVALQSLAVVEVQDEQQTIGAALEAMGDGFNTLSGAVVEAHDASRQVASRQDRLERTVERRTAAALPPAESPQALIGRGQHRRTGAVLPVFELLPGSPTVLTRLSDDGEDAAGGPWSLEPMGRRLYAVGADGPCLEVLLRDETGDGFVAADCSEPFAIWRFE